MMDANPSDTPFPTVCKKTSIESNALLNPNKYKRLIYRLLYLIVTRPDITFATHNLANLCLRPQTDTGN